MTITDPAPAIAAALAGDVEAYGEVVRAYDDELRGFVARRCHDPATIDEICHDAFVTAFRRLDRFDPASGPFPGWLKGIARNLLRRHHEALALRLDRLDRLARLQLDRARTLLPRDDDRLEALRRCLDKLPPPRRELLDRRYREAQDVRALAESLGRTVTWVTTNLQRARDAVRACMGTEAA